ncbi:MAG: hypothetical protein K9N06_04525 [Candidatus Cloacimonetes bacterium]|nr:hypothetical protein [Candidatus Cloacimonadota bacterium]
MRKQKKEKKPRQIIGILVVVLLLSNIGYLHFGRFHGFYGVFSGVINGFIYIVLILWILKLFNNHNREKAEENEKDREETREERNPQIYQLQNQPRKIPQRAAPHTTKESVITADLELALQVVKDHLNRRGYKTTESSDPRFEIIALDSQKKEFFVKIIAFTKDNKDNRLILSAETYREAQKLGRNFLLFVVTELKDDADASYLGNYIKAYKLDSTIDDAGFKQEDGNYVVTLGKFSKNASDWETRIRRTIDN